MSVYNREFISIIVPVRNNEDFIEICLHSILKNKHKNLELIVVDNASNDSTGEKILNISKNDSRVIYVYEPNISIGAARNAGIMKAKGDIVLMTDSDCVVPNNWIDKIIIPILQEDEDIVMGGEYNYSKNYWSDKIQEANEKFILQNKYGNYVHAFDAKNFAIKASILKKYMFDPEIKRLEDFDFFIRIRDKVKIRYMPEIKVGHKHKTSLIGWAILNFKRGFWVKKIYDKNKKMKVVNNTEKVVNNIEPMFESIENKNLIKFIDGMIWNFIRNDFGDMLFKYVSEISWRLGIKYADFKDV